MAKTKMMIRRPSEGALEKRSPTIVERVPVPVMKLMRAPRSGGRRPTALLDGLAHVAVGVAGGFAGAGATALLSHAGASPLMSGLGVTLAGGTGAVMSDGKLRTFSASAAATGFSSAMMSLFVKRQVAPPPRPPVPPARQAALSDDEIYAALRASRNADGWDDFRNAYDDDYRNADGWEDYRNADGWEDYRNADGWDDPYRNAYEDDYRNAPYAAEAAE